MHATQHVKDIVTKKDTLAVETCVIDATFHQHDF